MALTWLPPAGAAPVSAATLKVNTTTDETTPGDHLCSLREAVAAVNSPGTATDCGVASRASNKIVLGAGTYSLSIAPTGTDDNSSGDLNVSGTAPLTISGAGQSETVIDASGLGDRVLSLAAGASVTLKNLEITGGNAANGAAGATYLSGNGGNGGSGAAGGGIYNAGTLSLAGVGVDDNAAGAGGSGGGSPGGRGGSGGSGAGGGGIYNAGTLKVTGSTIIDNTAGGGGAGGSALRLHTCYEFCLPVGNGGGGGGGGAGGGIDNAGAAARLTVTDSTISGNRGGDGGTGGFSGGFHGDVGGAGGGGGTGGGIASQDGTLVLRGSTIAGNAAGLGGSGGGGFVGGAPGGAGAGGDGGAIAATGLTSASLVRNATVANNAAGAGGSGRGGHGGGLAIATEKLTLQNTVVASNNANGAANCDPSSGVANGGHDLSYGDSSCPGANGNPELLPLSDYGGPTQTMALGPGSAAIDQVPPTGAGCPKTDQRGVKRPQARPVTSARLSSPPQA